jgi:phospholipase A1
MKYLIGSISVFLIMLSSSAQADKLLQNCLLEQLQKAEDSQTVGDLKQVCQQQYNQLPEDIKTSKVLKRAYLERQESNPFTLLPHKPSYLILSHNFSSPNEAPFDLADPNRGYDFQPLETKFQISLKIPVVRDLFNKADIFVAYTNRSFWQQFNKEGSAPFRDSNHEPELWLSFKNDTKLLGFTNRVIRAGINHQSNGQSGALSRSWNRLFAEFIFERNNLALSLKPWWRIPEKRDEDDNPDIEEHMGNFELSALYQYKQHTVDVMVRNNLDFGDNYGALQLGWSFPLTDNIRGYVQWFNGYGESMIDYNSHSNSLGFGIQLADWL